MRLKIFTTLTTLCIFSLMSGCVSYRAIGSLSNGQNPAYGTVNGNLMDGSAQIAMKFLSSGEKCSGASETKYIPNQLVCDGQVGGGVLYCDSERKINFSWVAESCTSGKGFGQDNFGNELQFVYGMNDEEASKQMFELYQITHQLSERQLQKEIQLFSQQYRDNTGKEFTEDLMTGLAVGAILFMSFESGRLQGFQPNYAPSTPNIKGGNLDDPSQNKRKTIKNKTTEKANTCYSSTECGIGQNCIKKPGQLKGVCAKSFDARGNQNLDIDVDSFKPGTIECNYSSDCPTGYACDSIYKKCLKK
ncbi:MAG: hypothetical protein RI556_11200 [Hydrogenovibrio sp.]|uniref:hypothetical protein n=1 Tax=Hydrogenovibrio sp. TaxID=2065821 RepID=UPI0028702309|nr:hypothetical protein [Hydrogenovibrio sp.]MDR9499732.1 hypothetical protein [Hydrogenovibrio sp.]